MKSILLLCVSTFSFSLPALAQTTGGELREETIIVSAPGGDRSAGELISHVTSLSQDELIKDLAGTLGDTLDRQPGVSTTFFGAGASRPVLRGLGAERVLVLSGGLGAIDASAASPDHQSSGDGIDAERIEILRGPAALAYGGQAVGGVVNVIDGLIVDTLPDPGVSAKGFLAGNSVNQGTEASGRVRYVTGPVVLTASASSRDFEAYDIPGFAESARFRANEALEDHDDHDDHDDHEDHDDDEVSGRVENSFLTTDTRSLGLSYVGDRAYLGVSVRQTTSKYGLPGHNEHEDEDDHHEEEGEEAPFIDLEQTRFDIKGGLKLDHDILRKIRFAISSTDYEHIEFEAPGEPGTVYKTDGVEARVEVDHTIASLTGTVGAQYFSKSFGAFGDEAFITPTDSENFGVFIYETRDWDDGFGIEGGLRQEHVYYDNQVFGSEDFDLTSAAFGVHKHNDGNWFVGFQAAYTERAPNESELFAEGPHLATAQYEIGDIGLRKEGALNAEATLRWEGESSSIGANVFFTKFNDFIYLRPTGAELDELPVWIFDQQNANFTGFEIYGDHTFCTPFLGADWRVEGNVDYVQAELADGGNVPYLPPLTLNAELGADWGIFNAALTTTLAGKQNDPGEGVLPTDGYAVFGLRGAVDLDTWMPGTRGVQLFADVRNLTDEEIRYSTSVLKDTVPAPGRNVRLGLKISL